MSDLVVVIVVTVSLAVVGFSFALWSVTRNMSSGAPMPLVKKPRKDDEPFSGALVTDDPLKSGVFALLTLNANNLYSKLTQTILKRLRETPGSQEPYCDNCGESDPSNLAHTQTTASFERYTCLICENTEVAVFVDHKE